MTSKTNFRNCQEWDECHKLPTNWNEWLKCNDTMQSIPKNWNELLNITLCYECLIKNYNNCFLEYNIFSKSRKKITSSREHYTRVKEENIIKIITETWI